MIVYHLYLSVLCNYDVPGLYLFLVDVLDLFSVLFYENVMHES